MCHLPNEGCDAYFLSRHVIGGARARGARGGAAAGAARGPSQHSEGAAGTPGPGTGQGEGRSGCVGGSGAAAGRCRRHEHGFVIYKAHDHVLLTHETVTLLNRRSQSDRLWQRRRPLAARPAHSPMQPSRPRSGALTAYVRGAQTSTKGASYGRVSGSITHEPSHEPTHESSHEPTHEPTHELLPHEPDTSTRAAETPPSPPTKTSLEAPAAPPPTAEPPMLEPSSKLSSGERADRVPRAHARRRAACMRRMRAAAPLATADHSPRRLPVRG